MKNFTQFISEDFDVDKPISGWDYGDNDEIKSIYDRKKYPKNLPLSEKEHAFLVDWSWNDEFIRIYQENGIEEIDQDIINELIKFRPAATVRLYRVIWDLEGEIKYKDNKLKSYCKNIQTALGMLGDKGYLDIRYFNPDKILVDTTLIPNYKNLDLIEEVICITDRDSSIPIENPFVEK
jgi:hypothetical protein